MLSFSSYTHTTVCDARYKGLKGWFNSICPISMINAILSYILRSWSQSTSTVQDLYWLLLSLPLQLSWKLPCEMLTATLFPSKKKDVYDNLHYLCNIVIRISLKWINYCSALFADKIPTYDIFCSALIHFWGGLRSCIFFLVRWRLHFLSPV